MVAGLLQDMNRIATLERRKRGSAIERMIIVMTSHNRHKIHSVGSETSVKHMQVREKR